MDIKLSDIKSADFGRYWNVVEKFYHRKYMGEEYVMHLASFLSSLNVQNILDVACGVGFPAIEIVKRGFNLTCSDGNRRMLRVFEQKVKEEKLTVPIFHSKWQDLPKIFPGKFDCVLCLDSSITYVNTWASPAKLDIEVAKNSIRDSLSAFFEILNPGGYIVIGLAKYSSLKGTEFTAQYEPMEIDGVIVRHRWIINFDLKTKLKTWKLVTEYGDEKDVREFQSYMLLPQELIELLAEVGFKKIDIREIDPKEYDNNFIAQR